MADNDCRTRCSLQPIFQPLYGFDVQVVGRLIEQEQVGLAQQDLCQFDTHSPSAGELVARAVEIRTLKSQAEQYAFHVPDTLRVLFVAHAVHLFAECCALVVDHVLRQVTDRHVAVAADMPAGGCLLAGYEAEQGCLACSVLAYQGNAVTFVDQKRDTSQYRLGGILLNYIFNA